MWTALTDAERFMERCQGVLFGGKKIGYRAVLLHKAHLCKYVFIDAKGRLSLGNEIPEGLSVSACRHLGTYVTQNEHVFLL